MQLSEHQRFMLETLGRHGATILNPKRWESVGPRLEAIWQQSQASHGMPWPQVESIAHHAWLDELRRFADRHQGD